MDTSNEFREFNVKVWHARSGSYTTIIRYAKDEDAVEQELESEYEDDNSWIFVSAEEVF